MANNSEILGEEAAVRQIVEGDYSATDGYFEDDSVITIRASAFRSQTSLIEVYFPNVTTINNNAFQDATNLFKASFPNATILYNSALRNCTSLESIYIPNVTTLGGDALRNCTSLEKIIMPSAINMSDCALGFIPSLKMVDVLGGTFQYGAIRDCANLKTLILRKSDGVVTLMGSGLGGTPIKNGAQDAYVYVPRNLISSYQTATTWSTLYAAHSDMFRALEDYTVDGTTTGEFGLIKYTVAGTGVLQTNGTVGNNSTYNYTDFFDIESDTVKIKFIAPTDVTAKYCQFFNGDTFIERQAFNNDYCTVPSGTTKARFCWYPNDVTDVNIVRRII